MVRLLIRLGVNAAAIWAAAYMIQGVTFDTSQPMSVLAVALVFGLVNAVLKPIVRMFSFPFLFLSLGLFTLVINAALFGVTAWLTSALSIQGVIPAFLGALVVSIVSWFLGIFVDKKDKE